MTVTRKLFILLVTVALVPLLSAAFFSFRSSQQTFRKLLNAHLSTKAIAAAKGISMIAQSVQHDLELLARDTLVQSALRRGERDMRIRLPDPGPPYDFVTLFDSRGDAIAHTQPRHPGTGVGKDGHQIDYDAVRDHISSKVAFVSTADSKALNVPGCKPSHCMGFLTRVRALTADGLPEPNGCEAILHASLCWSYLDDQLVPAASGVQDEKDLVMLVDEDSGQVVRLFENEQRKASAVEDVFPDFAEWMKRSRRSDAKNQPREATVDGQRFLVGLAPMDERFPASWWVVVASPTQATLEPLSMLRSQTLWILGGAILLASALAFFVGRRASAPLLELARHVEYLGQGKAAPRRLVATSRDEVGQLVEAFNRLSSGLRYKQNQVHALLARFDDLVRSSPDAILTLNLKGRVTHLNPAAMAVFGIDKSAKNQPLWHLIPPDLDADRWRDALTEVASEGSTNNLEFERTDSQNVGRYYAALFAPIRNRRRDLVRVLVVLRDLTELRETEKRLERQNKTLRKLYELRVSSRGRRNEIYESSVRVLADLFHAPIATAWQLQGDRLTSLAYWEEGELHRDVPATRNGRHALARGDRASIHADLSHEAPDHPLAVAGRKGYLGYPVLDRDGNPLGLVCVIDRKERTWGREDADLLRLFAQWIAVELEVESLQRNFVHHEKMASLGGLAAGMAHEINNPLAGVLQNLQLLQYGLSPNDDVTRRKLEELGFDETQRELLEGYFQTNTRKYLERIGESGRRAAKIVGDLLDFSRRSDTAIERHTTEEILTRSVNLARVEYDLKKRFDIQNIDVQIEILPGSEELVCDANQLEQVFLNLIKNAAHALHEKSQQDNRFAPSLTIRSEPVPNGVLIAISDNGPGIGESPPERIFEPFYTTKRVGEGTGLGLYVSYFLVTEGHGGSMRVHTRPGEGTTFEIFLPSDARRDRAALALENYPG